MALNTRTAGAKGPDNEKMVHINNTGIQQYINIIVILQYNNSSSIVSIVLSYSRIISISIIISILPSPLIVGTIYDRTKPHGAGNMYIYIYVCLPVVRTAVYLYRTASSSPFCASACYLPFLVTRFSTLSRRSYYK